MAQVYYPVKPEKKVQLPDIWETISSSGIHIDIADFSTFPVPSTNENHTEAIPQPHNSVYAQPNQRYINPPNISENHSMCHMILQGMMKKKRKEGKRTMFTDTQRTILLDWLRDHKSDPYPTIQEKNQLMLQTGLNRHQINNWFTNNRIRLGMTGSHANTGQNATGCVSNVRAF